MYDRIGFIQSIITSLSKVYLKIMANVKTPSYRRLKCAIPVNFGARRFNTHIFKK